MRKRPVQNVPESFEKYGREWVVNKTTAFEYLADKGGVRRTECVAMYKHKNSFEIHTLRFNHEDAFYSKKGTWRMCGNEDFGSLAYYCLGEKSANEKFDELIFKLTKRLRKWETN